MPDAPRNSFIPRKSNAPIQSRKLSKQAVGAFGYVSYISFFGAVILAGAVFFISYQVQSTLDARIVELEQAKNQFQQSDMDRVQAFERYTHILHRVFNQSFSTAGLFSAIEQSVADSAVLSTLQLKREVEAGYPTDVVVNATINTSTFDSALFQRGVYEQYPLLQNFTVNEVLLLEAGQSAVASEDGDLLATQLAAVTASEGRVSFTLEFLVDPETLSFDPRPLSTNGQTVPEADVDSIFNQADDEQSGIGESNEDEVIEGDDEDIIW